MTDRFRSAASRLADQARRLRPGPDRATGVDDEDDDDPDAEDLPPLQAGEDIDVELAELDEADAEPIEIGDRPSFIEMLRELDPTPDLPLSAPHEIGFASLLERLMDGSDGGTAEDRRVRRVLDLVGDRLSLSVGPDGIAVRGLIRTRRTPWANVGTLTFTSRHDLVREDGLQKLTDDVAGRLMPIPIPGVRWLLKRVIGGLSQWLEKKFFTDEGIRSFLDDAGVALTHVARRGFDVELSGPLLLVSILGAGFSEAAESEARGRNIEVVIVEEGRRA